MYVSSSTSAGIQGAGRMGFNRPTGADWSSRLGTDDGKKFLKVVSDKTGISTDALTKQLEGGADLGQILRSSGVKPSDFRAALDAAGIKPPGGAPQGMPPGPPPSDGSDGDSDIKATILKALSDALKVDPKDLKKQLDSGASLDGIAKDKGVSQEDLLKVIMQALSTQLGYGADGTRAATVQSASIQVDAAA